MRPWVVLAVDHLGGLDCDLGGAGEDADRSSSNRAADREEGADARDAHDHAEDDERADREGGPTGVPKIPPASMTPA